MTKTQQEQSNLMQTASKIRKLRRDAEAKGDKLLALALDTADCALMSMACSKSDNRTILKESAIRQAGRYVDLWHSSGTAEAETNAWIASLTPADVERLEKLDPGFKVPSKA
jgi:hypothetical protein